MRKRKTNENGMEKATKMFIEVTFKVTFNFEIIKNRGLKFRIYE